MKGKVISFSLLFIFGLINSSFSQDKKSSLHFEKVIWFGIDFTAARFTLVPENPSEIVNKYLKELNLLILSEPDKYNIKNYFNIKEVTNNIDLVNEFNSKIDPSNLVIYDAYKIDIERVKEVIKKYEVKDNSGTGLIFVAENLNKVSNNGSYYVCFFDIKTKEILDFKRMFGAVGGFGFRNYWARSVYNVMMYWNPY
jgi:hypothetical protein